MQNKVNVASSILGGINALISIGTMIYTHSLTNSFKVQHNDISVPTGYAPLRTFNEDAAANLNSYVFEENADGIFVF